MNNIKYNTCYYNNSSPSETQYFEDISGISSTNGKCIIKLSNDLDEVKPKIINLSVQAQPGLKLYINDGNYPVIVNSNSIFQWQINQPNTYIEKIAIDAEEEINPSANIIISYEYYE